MYLLGRVVGAAEEDVLLPADGDFHAGRRLRIAHVVVVYDEQGQLLQVLPARHLVSATRNRQRQP